MSAFYFDFLDLANAADLRKTRRDNRRTRWANNAFLLSHTTFIKRYRLSKELARSLIAELTPYMPQTKRTDGLDVPTKILIALQCFASNSYQTQVGDLKYLSVAQSTVSKALHEVIEALNTPAVFQKYIKFPQTRQERERIKSRFYMKFNIPGVLGCVDGTHVSILRPVENEEWFFNRKGYHSLNVMIICDSDLQVMCVDPSYPGSTHDSVVWSNHSIKRRLEGVRYNSDEEFFILGDSEYPLRTLLMTPILNAQPNTPEAYYTEVHIRTRNVVERCIGVLKARFRCLLAARRLHYCPTTAAKMINACCILHNIAHSHGIPFEPLTPEQLEEERRMARDARAVPPPQDVDTPPTSDLQHGREARATLVARLWAARTN